MFTNVLLSSKDLQKDRYLLKLLCIIFIINYYIFILNGHAIKTAVVLK